MKLQVHSISFRNSADQYLDIEVIEAEGYVALKIDSQPEFGIETVEELDLIYNKLKELLEDIHNET